LLFQANKADQDASPGIEHTEYDTSSVHHDCIGKDAHQLSPGERSQPGAKLLNNTNVQPLPDILTQAPTNHGSNPDFLRFKNSRTSFEPSAWL
jgi:hypothetical protein